MGSSFPILYFAPWPSCLCFSSFFDGMQPSLVKSKLRMFEPSLWLSSGTQRVVVGTVVWRFLANIFWETGQTTGIEFNQFMQRVHAHQEPYVLMCWATSGFQPGFFGAKQWHLRFTYFAAPWLCQEILVCFFCLWFPHCFYGKNMCAAYHSNLPIEVLNVVHWRPIC